MEKDKNSISIITKIIIGLSIIIAMLSLYILLVVELPNKPLAGQGGKVEEDIPIGGNFVLTDQNGNEFSSKQMQGKLSLIYFGFTYCPDICPTSLQKLTTVLNALDKYKIEILPIFITIDPLRDTTSVLKEYLSHFHPNFIGLTGTEEKIREVADLYKVFYARSDNPNYDQGNYMLDHSSFAYLMDKKGKYMKHFYLNTPPEEIIEYIRVNK